MRIGSRARLIAASLAVVGILLPDAVAHEDEDASPAECGQLDSPEAGMQGGLAPATGVNCGLSLVSEFASGANAVQGHQHCAYTRHPDPGGTAQKEEPGGVIRVWNMTDPSSPALIREVTYKGGSETMRIRITPDRGRNPQTRRHRGRQLLVNGRNVFEISDCENPVPKGEIPWRIDGVFESDRPSHDIRISEDGTKVWASTGTKMADISNLEDPSTWMPVTYRCDLGRQAGNPFHQTPVDFCELMGEFPSPTYIHSPDVNDSDTRLYIGGQTIAAAHTEQDVLRILDTTPVANGQPPKILDSLDGPGHSMDWFRIADGREFILHANEIGAASPSTCLPHPRPSSLGFANEAFLTEVTNDELVRASLVEMAISKPKNCQYKLTSGEGQATDVSYHMVDNPKEAHFALISFGPAGLRMIDIRDPYDPHEVAYYNRGRLQHAGVSHYDAERGLLYVPGPSSVQVLEIQPQVFAKLGLGQPSRVGYPRYPQGRPATPGG